MKNGILRKWSPAAVMLAWFLVPAASHAASACVTTAASLKGWYGMLVSGSTTAQPAAAKYLTGAVFFDGAGTLSGSNIYGANGGTPAAISGNYTLNSDCTIALTTTVASTPSSYTVALKNTGEAVGIETDSTAVATISLKPQYATYTTGLNFTSSSLNGTFAASCAGDLSASTDLNLVVFSNGTLSGTDPFNNGGGYISSNVPYSGTYTVNSDGTFAGSLTVEDTPFDYFGVVTNSNTQVEYIYSNVTNNVASAPFAACVGGLAPPSAASPPPSAASVNLTSYYNADAVFTNGTRVTNGGLDSQNYAYSRNLLGSSVTWKGLAFAIGPANGPDAVSNATVPLPSGQYSTLYILAGSTDIPSQPSGTIIVTYTDKTTSTFNQTFSDWGYPHNYPNEAIAFTMAYRVTPSGATQAGPWYLYGYTYALNNAKTVASVTLPATKYVRTLSAVLAP
jgi:hypothetical protein